MMLHWSLLLGRDQPKEEIFLVHWKYSSEEKTKNCTHISEEKPFLFFSLQTNWKSHGLPSPKSKFPNPNPSIFACDCFIIFDHPKKKKWQIQVFFLCRPWVWSLNSVYVGNKIKSLIPACLNDGGFITLCPIRAYMFRSLEVGENGKLPSKLG